MSVVPYDQYMRLKLAAVDILKLVDGRELPYYEETNIIGQIIRKLYEEKL